MKFQKQFDENRIQCLVCPRECILADNQHGFCHVRKNIGGEIVSTTYGHNAGMHIDPIEKKPLYHFYPGSPVLSFGTLGCNLDCDFCQNAHLSRSKENPKTMPFLSPQNIVETALEHNCKSIAYTYNDPVVFLEYAVDTAKIAKEHGVKNIAVTAGFINPDARKEFFKNMDAANIDLKGFTDEFYKKHCKAHLEPVLDTIKYVKHHTDIWLELTTLLIEGENDSDEEIKKECMWIKENLGVHVPIHFSAFFPTYKLLDKPPTSSQTLIRAFQIATDIGLKYVYTGNISSAEMSSTYCENCNNLIIGRDGYTLTSYHLNSNGHCQYCGHKCHGRFD